MGDFGIRVGTPGNLERAGLLSAQKKGVLDDDPCQGVGRMGELVGETDVSGGIYARVGCLEIVVDLYPFPTLLTNGVSRVRL